MKAVVVKPTGDINIDTNQRAVKAAVGALQSSPIATGQLLADISVSASSTPIPHNLGRAVRGFFVVSSTADVRVWRDATSTVSLVNFLPLVSSATATVSLWVF